MDFQKLSLLFCFCVMSFIGGSFFRGSVLPVQAEEVAFYSVVEVEIDVEGMDFELGPYPRLFKRRVEGGWLYEYWEWRSWNDGNYPGPTLLHVVYVYDDNLPKG
jgi:hypothetical protein